MLTVRWELYPRVSANPVTRAFIEELAQVRKSPSTIDNYSRDLDDFLRRTLVSLFLHFLRQTRARLSVT
jgi:hypothetical protein